MDKIKTPNHLLNALIPHPCNREHDYSFPRNNNNRNFYTFNNRSYCGQSYVVISLLINTTRNTCMHQTLACIFQTLI